MEYEHDCCTQDELNLFAMNYAQSSNVIGIGTRVRPILGMIPIPGTVMGDFGDIYN